MIIKILQPCKMFSSIPKNWQKSLLNKMVVMDHGVSMFPCQSQDCFLPPSSPLSACFRPWWAWSRLTEFPPNPSHIRTRLRHPTTHCCKTRPPYLSKAMFCCLQLSGVRYGPVCCIRTLFWSPLPPPDISRPTQGNKNRNMNQAEKWARVARVAASKSKMSSVWS